jgi:adenylate cyclase
VTTDGADVGPEDLRAQIEALVLGAAPVYDQATFVEASGVELTRARRYWRALGFSDAEPDEAPYTDTDISALQRAISLVDEGGIEEKYVLALTRALGHTMARLADWEVDIAVDRLHEEGRDLEDIRARNRLEQIMPDLEHMLVHAWRRHLLAAVGRVLDAQEDGLATVTLTVGFADLVGFTGLSRRLDEDALGALVERFERWASELVISMGGRLVKTLGDEVLFATEEPDVGVRAALGLAAGMAEDSGGGAEQGRASDVPPVRVGVATGRVIHRMGDLFGTPVNLASRLTTFAVPGSVLADGATAGAAADLPGVRATPLMPRPVRGLGIVEPWLLAIDQG